MYSDVCWRAIGLRGFYFSWEQCRTAFRYREFAKNGNCWQLCKGSFLRGKSAAEFEKSLVKLPQGEKVVQVKIAAVSVAAASGMVKDSSLSKMNGRDVYKEKNGYLFALDTQNGRFEMVNPKNGKRLGEFDLDFNKIKSADKNGSHGLKVR